jgi:hypothetical protein
VTPHLAEALTRSLYCGVYALEGRVSVYVSFSDESASADGKGYFLIAGYIAKETEWPEFSRRWQDDILDPQPKIPYIHMTEIRSREWRETHGISREQANEKVNKAVGLITNCDYISAYTARLPEGFYSEIRERFKEKGFGLGKHHTHPDYPCFAAFAMGVVQDMASKHSDITKITFNISRKKYVENYIRDLVRDAIVRHFADFRPGLENLVGDVVPLSMEDHKPLQAADVFGWHLQRICSGNVTPEDEFNATAITANAVGLTFSEKMLEETAESTLRQYGVDHDE